MTIQATPQSNTPAGPSNEPANVDIPVGEPQQEVIIKEVAPEPKVISVPTHAMKKIKEDSAALGRKQFQQELDAQAAELGYKNHEDWVRASREARAASSTTPSSTPATASTSQPETKPATASAQGGDGDQLVAENQRLKQEKENALSQQKRLNRQLARSTRESNKLKNQLLAQEATTELKLAAKDAGVQDVDYAVTVYERMIAGMGEEDLKTVDERKFFGEQLRKSHPHLYQAVDKLVSTGTRNQQEITKPATSNGNQQKPGTNQEGGAINARNMTPDAFQTLLRSRGMSNPSTGGAIG